MWAVVDALAGGGALLGGPQPANALPLIDLSLPHYHLHHLSHSHQHTFLCPMQRHCLCKQSAKSSIYHDARKLIECNSIIAVVYVNSWLESLIVIDPAGDCDPSMWLIVRRG